MRSFPHSREHFEMAHGGNFSGIYGKVQLKPLKWDGEGEEERPVEALMILKYGGVLTHVGEGTGLLRLHSIYHHDLKIYSSDEGRVQMSAAAFAKGMVDLEGQLRQSWFSLLNVSLVGKDSSMLDGLDTANIEIKAAKVCPMTGVIFEVYNMTSSRYPFFPPSHEKTMLLSSPPIQILTTSTHKEPFNPCRNLEFIYSSNSSP
ncbi:hypothetical protein YC2023_070958 [Brassica napus]